MKQLMKLTAIALVAMLAAAGATAAKKEGSAKKVKRDDSAAEALGWRVAIQSYSLKKFTFFEAVDMAASVGIKYVEAYSKQSLTKENPKETTHFSMSAETRKKMKAKLKEAGVTLVNYGVVKGKNEEEWIQIFEFAKDMGIETLVSEPKVEEMDLLDRLTKKYKINIAIHNHPAPSTYWNPETVLDAIEGRGKRIGACADTGHWMRSKVVPLEAIKKLEGRIISLHMKDLNEFGIKKQGEHDVPWGEGEADIPAILAELKRQKVKAVFSIEYEHNWDNSLPEIGQCVKNFDKMVRELSK